MIASTMQPIERPRGGRRTRYGVLIGLCLLAALATTPAARSQSTAAAEQAVEDGRLEDAQRLLEQRLGSEPSDDESRFLLARVLAWRNDHPAALEQYDRLLAAQPEHVDYLFGKAQVLVMSQRAAEALPLLERGRALAPDYEALWRLELQALAASGADPARRQALRSAARARFPQTDWPLETVPRPSPASRLEFGLGYESLNRGFDDWSEAALQAERRLPGGQSIYARLRATERFDLRDTELGGGAYLPLTPDWLLQLEATGAPDADVLARWLVYAGLRRALPAGYAVQAGLRRAGYADVDVSVLALTGERYWGAYRAAYTLYAGKPDGAQTGYSHQLRFDRYYGTDGQIGIALTGGEEVERIVGAGGGQVLVTDVRSAALLGRHDVAADWALGWELGYHEQGDIYRKLRLRLGLSHRF